MRLMETAARPAAGRGGTLPWRRDPMLLGLAAVPVVALAGLAWSGDPAHLRGQYVFAFLLLIPVNVSWAANGHRIARLLGRGHPARQFWRVWVACGALSVLGSAVQVVQALHRAPQPQPARPAAAGAHDIGSLPDLISIVAMLVLGFALLTFPIGLRTRRERLCYWLDMATVMVGAAGFGGYAIFSASDAPLADGAVPVFLGPVLHLAVLFLVSKILISGAAPFGRLVGMVALVGSLIMGAAKGLGPALLAQGYGRWYLLATVLATALLALSPRLQQRQYLSDPEALTRRRRRPYSLLPYAAVAAIYALLVVSLDTGGLDSRSWVVLAAAIASTGLVIARQLAAFADNSSLLGRLTAKVDELKRAKAVLQAALDERDALAEQLRSLAFHDSLTGLANRALLLDRGDLAISRAGRGGEHIVLMLVDLDDFKPVNDRYGHAAGDEVLRAVAFRLRGCVRETDTVARLGGDEFAILLENFDLFEPPIVSVIAERILAAVSTPVEIAGATVAVGASIGVACDRGGKLSTARLLETADAAMYSAKGRGKGRYAIANAALLGDDADAAAGLGDDAGAAAGPANGAGAAAGLSNRA